MEKLSKDWITEKRVDFEYKKYILLAYLQHVSESFRLVKLYPPLADLIGHYKTAKGLRDNKQSLSSLFPKQLTGIDPETFSARYEEVIADDKLMEEIETILDFSLPKFAGWVNEGRQIYDFVEKEIALLPVGLMPIDESAGYLFLRAHSAETQVYSYTITLFEQPDATWRGINVKFIRSYRQSIACSYESIKTDLVEINREFPNPAVYAAETNLAIPFNETFLPIAKRMLVRTVTRIGK